MRGVPIRRDPPGRLVPVAATSLHAGSPFRKVGPTVKIDTIQDVQRGGGPRGARIRLSRVHAASGPVESRPFPAAALPLASLPRSYRSHCRATRSRRGCALHGAAGHLSTFRRCIRDRMRGRLSPAKHARRSFPARAGRAPSTRRGLVPSRGKPRLSAPSTAAPGARSPRTQGRRYLPHGPGGSPPAA